MLTFFDFATMQPLYRMNTYIRVLFNYRVKLFQPLMISHSGIIFQLGYDTGHIGNPFFPHFYPHRSEYPAPLHLMWPRINNQQILDPV